MQVLDKLTNKIEMILEETSNSYLITQTKRTEKGINCSNWFDSKTFNERFKII